MPSQSRSAHVLELARELLDDIELGRVEAEKLILKTSRLARWAGSEEIQYWLSLELGGYHNGDDIARRYMGINGRWIDRDKGTGYWGPFAEQQISIDAQKARLASMRIPDNSSPLVINTVTATMGTATQTISRLGGVRSRVLAQLHKFISDVYYEKEFESLSESIFEKYKSSVDTLISAHCGDVLQKIPSVMDRLSDGDEESISQALNTCRRIITSFADSVFPPTTETIVIGGNTLSLDASKVQNRINAYIYKRTTSQSRTRRLRQNLANLFDRASGGVHDEITAEEARSLFLNTYLFLGEVLHLPGAADVSDPSQPAEDSASALRPDENDSGESKA